MSSSTRRIAELERLLHEEPALAHGLLHRLRNLDRPFLLRSELHDIVEEARTADGEELTDENPLVRVLEQSQEAALGANWIYLALRPRTARWEHLRLHLETLAVESMRPSGSV